MLARSRSAAPPTSCIPSNRGLAAQQRGARPRVVKPGPVETMAMLLSLALLLLPASAAGCTSDLNCSCAIAPC